MHPTHIGIHIHMRVAAGAAALDIGIMLRSDARDRNTEWKPYLYQSTHLWLRPGPPPGTKLACPTHTPSHANQAAS